MNRLFQKAFCLLYLAVGEILVLKCIHMYGLEVILIGNFTDTGHTLSVLFKPIYCRSQNCSCEIFIIIGIMHQPFHIKRSNKKENTYEILMGS